MPKWEGKTRGGVLGYAIFVFFISHFHLRIVYFILNFVVIYFLFFSPKSLRVMYRYFRKRKKFGRIKSLRYVRKNYYFLGQSIIDKIALYAGKNTGFTFDLDGECHLQSMSASGKGGFLISAHVGNWDIAGRMLQRIKSKINVVMLDAEHQRIKKYLAGIMKEQEVTVIPIKDDFSHLIKIKDALQNNELVCIHGDRFLEGMREVRKLFLGKEASFPQGPFVLPLKFNVPVSFVFAMKEGFNHYHFYASSPVTFSASKSPKDRERDSNALLDSYIVWLERMLEVYPEQWYNYFEFWS